MSHESELDLKLIKAVQKRPLLYTKKQFSYSEVSIKAWTQIAKELKLNKDYCIRRWLNLRKRYSRPRSKEWSLASHLTFLEPYIHRRKKGEKDILLDFTSVPSYQKESGPCTTSGSKPKPVATSESAQNNEKRDNPFTNFHFQSPSSFADKIANQSFCESLLYDLQTLTADQRMKCKIDIMSVVNNCQNPRNEDNLKTNHENHNFDVPTSALSKRFAAVSDKVRKGTMKTFDEDWLLIFAVNDFFIELLKERKKNPKLDRMLLSFHSIDITEDLNELQQSQSSVEHDFSNSSSSPVQSGNLDFSHAVDQNSSSVNSLPVQFVKTESTIDDHQVQPRAAKDCPPPMEAQFYEDDPNFFRRDNLVSEPTIKTEFKNSSDDFFFGHGNLLPQEALTFEDAATIKTSLRNSPLASPNDDSSVKSVVNMTTTAVQQNSHSVLKNLKSTDGITRVNENQFICLLCNVTLSADLYVTHTLSSSHKNLIEEYRKNSDQVKDTAIHQLDPSVYAYKSGGLHCLKCDVPMQNRHNFLTHLKSSKHKKLLKSSSVLLDIDMLGDRSIGKGIVKINNCDYCLLCNVKISGIMHAMSPNHKKVTARLEGIFKISRKYGYCTHCNEVFPFSNLDLHLDLVKHAANIEHEVRRL